MVVEMEITINPDDPKDLERIEKVKAFWTGNDQINKQQKIVPICEVCGERLTEKEVNYCKVKYPDQHLCKTCQQGAD